MNAFSFKLTRQPRLFNAHALLLLRRRRLWAKEGKKRKGEEVTGRLTKLLVFNFYPVYVVAIGRRSSGMTRNKRHQYYMINVAFFEKIC